MTSAYEAASRHRHLRCVLVGWSAVMTAEWAYLTALLVIAFDYGGPVAVGLAGLARMGPAGLAAPVVAAIGGRFRRRDVLAVSAAARCVVILCSAVAIAAGSGLALLFVLAAVDAIIGTGIRPAQGALLPQLAADARQLAEANTVISAMFIGGMMVGSLIGGFLCAAIGGEWVYVLAAALFALAAAEYARLPAGQKPQAVRRVSDVWSGFRAARSNPSLAGVVGFTAFQMLVRGLSVPMFVIIADDVIGRSAGGVGVILGALGAGGLLGIAAGRPLVRRSAGVATTYGLALAGGGLFLAFAGLVQVAATVVGFILVRGTFLALADAAGVTLIQRNADDTTRASVLGVMESLTNLMIALGSILAPVLVSWLGITTAVAVTGFSIPVATLAAMVWFRRLDVASAERDHLVSLIAAQPVFSSLGLAPLDMLAAGARCRSYTPGTNIVEQGAPAMAYFGILSGHVDVFVDDVRVGSLGAGSGFGEVALLRDTTRTATVRAVSNVEVLGIDRARFIEAIAPAGPAAEALAHLAELRLGSDPKRRPERQTDPADSDRELLRDMVLDVRGLQDAGRNAADALVRTAVFYTADTGALITRVGDRAEAVWILLDGRAEMSTATGEERTVGPGTVVGDAAAADDCPLDATTTASETCRLAAIEADAYRRTLGISP